MIFLQTGSVSNWFQGIVDNVISGEESSLAASFEGVYKVVIEFSNGIVAIGLLITGVYLILQFLISAQMDYASLLKIILMLGLYMTFTATTNVKTGSSIMAVTSQIMDGFETKMKNGKDNAAIMEAAVKAGQDDAKKAQDEKIASPTENEDSLSILDLKRIGDLIQAALMNFLDSVIDLIMIAISFMIIFISKFACALLIAFAPFCVAVSFIKGFEGSFMGMLKYFIVFKLWAVVAIAIKLALNNLGFLQGIGYAAGYKAVEGMNAPTPALIIMKLCYCVLLALTPMFADILISGSQSGGFFSGAMTKAAAGMGLAAKAAKSAPGKMIANAFKGVTSGVPSAGNIGQAAGGIAAKAITGMKKALTGN